jgi:hypothetical protein
MGRGLWYIRAVVRPVFIVLLVGLALSGCGYRLVGAGLGNVGSIAIRTPDNESREPGLELVVADALRRELLRRDGSRLVEDPKRASLIVSGRVLPVPRRARSFSSTVLSLEEEVVLRLDLSVARPDGSELGLEDLVESERYVASADIEAHRKNRDEALRRVAVVLASRFFDALGESLAAGGARLADPRVDTP